MLKSWFLKVVNVVLRQDSAENIIFCHWYRPYFSLNINIRFIWLGICLLFIHVDLISIVRCPWKFCFTKQIHVKALHCITASVWSSICRLIGNLLTFLIILTKGVRKGWGRYMFLICFEKGKMCSFEIKKHIL